MKGERLSLLKLIIRLLIFEYLYKTHCLCYYFNKHSKYYEQKDILKKEENDKTKDYERLNNCVKNRIPKISGILETAQYIRYTNNSLVRFGDGEIKLMLMKDTYFQKADEELSKSLKEVFNSNISSLSIAILNIMSGCLAMGVDQYNFYNTHKRYERWLLKNVNYSKQYFDAHITSPFRVTYNTSCELLDNVYNELREIWRDKNIVILRGDNGEEYKYDIYDTAQSQKVYFGKAKEAWSEYEEYKRLLMNEDKDSLFILSIGPTSKVLVYDLVKEGRRGLDLGHLAKDYNNFKNGRVEKHFF